MTARLGAHLMGVDESYQAEYRIRDSKGRWQWLVETGRVIERAEDGPPAADGRRVSRDRRAEAGRRSAPAERVPLPQRRLDDTGLHLRVPIYTGWRRPPALGQRRRAGGLRRNARRDREAGQPGFVHRFGWMPIILERRAALARGEPRSGELEVHTATGQTKWLHASAVPVRDPRTGSVIGALGSCYDITESKLAEIALHESRTTLLTVAESSADVLALFDRQRKCVFLNRAIPGLTPDPWLGAPVERVSRRRRIGRACTTSSSA